MASEKTELVVRLASASDAGALAWLRSLWRPAADADGSLERRMAAWLASEGDRRTTWLALRADSPVGMASVFEYCRMPRPAQPDSRWGYVGNVFVREDHRNRGIGTALVARIIAHADERGYARLVLSPSAEAGQFFRRAGFIVPDHEAGADRLLVRPGRLSR